METVDFRKGKNLIEEGEKVDRLYILLAGTVTQQWKGHILTLKPGTVIGLSDALNETYESSYSAADDIKVVPCYYKGFADLDAVFEEEPVYIFGFSKGSFRQCRDALKIYYEQKEKVESFYKFASEIYKSYSAECKKVGLEPRNIGLLDELEPIYLENQIEDWEFNYISSLNSVENSQIENIYGKNVDIVKGVIGISCNLMKRAMDAVEIMGFYLEEYAPALLSSDRMDAFMLFYELRKYAAERRLNPDDINEYIEKLYEYISESGLYDASMIKIRWAEYINHNFHEDTQAYEQALEEEQAKYDDCFAHICEFAGFKEAEIKKMRGDFDNYLMLEDKESKEDKERRIRKKAVDMFYKVYEAAFFKSLKTRELDPVIEMFLNFGFMDIEAVGIELADQLVELTDKLFLCQSENVYTIYTWLRAIYAGDREPSKNELDLDYRGFIIEERKAGNIAEDKVSQWMENKEEKVKFEINNFFKSANRTTSGKMSSFCPILTEDGFGAEPLRMMLTVSRLNEALAKIEEVDFKIFLRERYFSDTDAGIKSESYYCKVLPDIILMPNCGMRAMMWQEAGGIKTDTPGRFVFPMFTLDDIDRMMMYCCGSFRWEICRKEQGARWNDITSECLTSDFYDYFTFYRKNKDLTAENKEKIKLLLKSSRNNMREAFTKQYAIWINFESKGSLRLNKTERNILATYCPFAKAYRDKVSGHPMFEQSVSKYNIKTSQELHHLKTVLEKYEKNGGKVPDEVAEGLKYLQM